MKGVVFTEFLEMVEQAFSDDLADQIIEDADLPSGGAYTAVGTYPHSEMVSLVVALSERTGTPVNDLLKAYGKYLFGRFVVLYPHFFTQLRDCFSMFAGIEDVIHAEVRKLYPDADLPSFTVDQQGPDNMTLVYQSVRHFEDLAEGLIAGCIAHYGEQISFTRVTLGEGASRKEKFILSKQ